MSKKNKVKFVSDDLDIAIPVYGNFEILSKTIEAVVEACKDFKFKIYLCDDKSPDLEEKGRDFYKKFKEQSYCGGIRYNKQNEGFPFTANVAVNCGHSPYVLILNSDVILDKDSISIMLNHMRAKGNENIGITAPKLLFFPDGKDWARPAGKIQHTFLVFDIQGHPYHAFNGWSADHPFANRVKDVNAVTGACMLMKRSVWNEVKGFDLQYGIGTHEDVALCLECRMRGYIIRYLPQAFGFHYTGMSSQRYEKAFPINENFFKFKTKYKTVVPFDDFLQMGF